MDFVKLGKDGRFHSAIYHRFLHRIVRYSFKSTMLLQVVLPHDYGFLDVSWSSE